MVNAREARWRHRPGRGNSLPFTGWSDEEAETLFPQVGIVLYVLEPGEPIGLYHWEAHQEDFLVLSGEALLLVEGRERPLRQWDFLHCPPKTEHIVVGAGVGQCVVLGIGARKPWIGEEWGGYGVDELALRRGVGVEVGTSDAERAYERFGQTRPTRYREGWLPG